VINSILFPLVSMEIAGKEILTEGIVAPITSSRCGGCDPAGAQKTGRFRPELVLEKSGFPTDVGDCLLNHSGKEAR
jgi:hypothetical protein